VISPEGCSSILWRSADNTQDAAEALKLTAQDLLKLGIIDGVVPEPLGGAHRGAPDTIAALGDALDAALQPLLALDGAALVAQRKRKFIEMGAHGL
jgi:acetyl-CoA carboxylase carboxyl transferase subunit alpha